MILPQKLGGQFGLEWGGQFAPERVVNLHWKRVVNLTVFSNQQNKHAIFLSPKIASNLDDLSLTEFLMDNQNCVLIIEDAEELIVSRDNNHNSKLSFLLNLTDGLIGESLGIQIIATFNTDLKNIDKALLRKGRLTSIYDFKPLSIDKTNLLMNKLGYNVEVDTPLVLTDIFNFEIETNYQPKMRKAVGFGN